ncbi:PQQ-dependent sugar dehydrogenase [Wenzhouxiangella sp. AB-CW3]|uniref:PQQ-dependent sugar dehydrogenase n=1 Tax=Wenzhouxiangella sp. AB-CW3 TaxID=2771012 RepID=UPI00168BD83F|nr:PQQ-dependent sugar dehydrogenase [Wenzhouxiangella sp. AB-CW3]QOC21116.1 PQQ-dependent sugar dehydrogenase [Wenzhouxiangella sp. AB-CW3]
MQKSRFPAVASLLLGAGLASSLALSASTESISTEYQGFELTTVAEGLEHPWSIAFLPDGDMLVTERPGRLNRIDADGNTTVIEGTPEVVARGQGGLLEVVLHPAFEDNGTIYLTYSKGGDGEDTATALARGRLDGDRLHDVEDIFVQNRYSQPGRHYGSRLAWLSDGTLLMSIGDRGAEPPRAQDPLDHAGTLLRLNDDGSIPADNPFVDDDDVASEIYSMGHRNIQGLVVDPESGIIWATEHGPRGGDELNRIEPGLNYGWPVQSRGLDYRTGEQFGDSVRDHPDMVNPVVDWTPSLAASGLALLVDDHFAAWQGNLLAGGLRSEHIRRVELRDGEVVHEEELLRGHVGRIRDVRVGPDGNIYVATDSSDGAIYRMSPES